MVERLTAHWWIPIVRGAIAVLFGVAAIAWPGETVLVLILIFGAFCFVDGIFAIVTAVRFATQHERWAMLLIEGIIGVIFGVLAYLAPAAIALFFVGFFSAWAVITGIFELVTAIRVRRSLTGELLLIATGILSILLGLVLFFEPAIGLVVWAWTLGIYAIAFGILTIWFGVRLRTMHLA